MNLTYPRRCLHLNAILLFFWFELLSNGSWSPSSDQVKEFCTFKPMVRAYDPPKRSSVRTESIIGVLPLGSQGAWHLHSAQLNTYDFVTKVELGTYLKPSIYLPFTVSCSQSESFSIGPKQSESCNH